MTWRAIPLNLGITPGLNLHRHGRPYVVAGPLAAGTLPTFPLDVPPGQLVQFEGCTLYTQASTTATVTVQKNGSNVSGLTSISVTSTSSGLLVPTGGSFQVSDQDQYGIVIASPSGTGGLTVNFVTTVIS